MMTPVRSKRLLSPLKTNIGTGGRPPLERSMLARMEASTGSVRYSLIEYTPGSMVTVWLLPVATRARSASEATRTSVACRTEVAKAMSRVERVRRRMAVGWGLALEVNDEGGEVAGEGEGEGVAGNGGGGRVGFGEGFDDAPVAGGQWA